MSIDPEGLVEIPIDPPVEQQQQHQQYLPSSIFSNLNPYYKNKPSLLAFMSQTHQRRPYASDTSINTANGSSNSINNSTSHLYDGGAGAGDNGAFLNVGKRKRGVQMKLTPRAWGCLFTLAVSTLLLWLFWQNYTLAIEEADAEAAQSRLMMQSNTRRHHQIELLKDAAAYRSVRKRGSCKMMDIDSLSEGVWDDGYRVQNILDNIEHVARYHRPAGYFPRYADSTSVDFVVNSESLRKATLGDDDDDDADDDAGGVERHADLERDLHSVETDPRNADIQPCILVYQAAANHPMLHMINPTITTESTDDMVWTTWEYNADQDREKIYADYIETDENGVAFIHIPMCRTITVQWRGWPAYTELKSATFSDQNALFLQYIIRTLYHEDSVPLLKE